MRHNCDECDRPCGCPDYTPEDGCMTCGRDDCPAMVESQGARADHVPAELEPPDFYDAAVAYAERLAYGRAPGT